MLLRNVDECTFIYNLDKRKSLSSLPRTSDMFNSLLANSNQNLVVPANGNTLATGISPANSSSQQSLNMQSTTPSFANGKDDMRGWLYKWTNVGYDRLFIQ